MLIWLRWLLLIAGLAGCTWMAAAPVADPVGRMFLASGGLLLGGLGLVVALGAGWLAGSLWLAPVLGTLWFAAVGAGVIAWGRTMTGGTPTVAGGDLDPWRLANLPPAAGVSLEANLRDEMRQMAEAWAAVQGLPAERRANRFVQGTLLTLEEMRREHARLVVRTAELAAFQRNHPPQALENRRRDLVRQAAAMSDATAAAQMGETVRLLDQQLEEIKQLATLVQRLTAKRLQLVETMRQAGTRLAALDFADLKVAQGGCDGVTREVQSVRADLADLEAATARVLRTPAGN